MQIGELTSSASSSTGGAWGSSESSWIEVKLVDDEDRPLAHEPFHIKLPDGGVREGVLDGNGVLHMQGIPAGMCTISFPRLERHSWEQVYGFARHHTL